MCKGDQREVQRCLTDLSSGGDWVEGSTDCRQPTSHTLEPDTERERDRDK